MLKQIHLRIIGQVQGVSFRASAKREADRLKIAGWARNNEDDSVEVIAQGEEEKLRQFIIWCWEGPPSARVDDVEVEWQESEEKLKDFVVQ